MSGADHLIFLEESYLQQVLQAPTQILSQKVSSHLESNSYLAHGSTSSQCMPVTVWSGQESLLFRLGGLFPVTPAEAGTVTIWAVLADGLQSLQETAMPTAQWDRAGASE